jgi:hypothetical protein
MALMKEFLVKKKENAIKENFKCNENHKELFIPQMMIAI